MNRTAHLPAQVPLLTHKRDAPHALGVVVGTVGVIRPLAGRLGALYTSPIQLANQTSHEPLLVYFFQIHPHLPIHKISHHNPRDPVRAQ